METPARLASTTLGESMAGFTYTEDGALIVSDDRVSQFLDEWADEFEWLSQH